MKHVFLGTDATLQQMTQGKGVSLGGTYNYFRLVYQTDQPNVTITADVVSDDGRLSMLNFSYSKSFGSQ